MFVNVNQLTIKMKCYWQGLLDHNLSTNIYNKTCGSLLSDIFLKCFRNEWQGYISSNHLLSHVQFCDPHGLEHARLPCPSSTPGVCLNSCSSNQWYHPTISSSVIPFSWLTSFRMDWFDLPVAQGTLKSLLQPHSSKAPILCSAFFIVRLSHPYMTTGKTIALTRWTFLAK